MSTWQKALIDAGGPLLKSLIEKGVGGGLKGAIAGKIAEAALEALGEAFGAPPTPEDIGAAIEKDPIGGAVVVQSVEEQFKSVLEIGTGDLTAYISLLAEEQKSEGLLTRLWRPLFAIGFTVTYVFVGFVIGYLMLNRELSTLNNLAEVSGFLTFYFVAGCAVLGVQIYQRSEEKKSGVN